MKITTRFLIVALVAVPIAALAGCSKSEDKPAESATPSTVAAPATAPAASAAAPATAAAAAIKPENADQVAAALEKEIEADAADEEKE